MREPRPRQRLPEGGLEIYERQKAGTWKPGTEILIAYPVGWKSPRGGSPRFTEMFGRNGYTLVYQPHFDPMLYFWPVEGFCIHFHVDNHDSDHTKRLVRASLRDGADIAMTYVGTALTGSSKFYTQEMGWKKPSAEYDYQVYKGMKR